MIPGIISTELRETILDYLNTTFSFQDASVAAALEAFLRDPDQGIFKGPYLHLRLPYRRGEKTESDRLLEVRPGFRPFVHQILAFERLTSKDGHQPQHTLVTSGTGSGKTECYLYPILDHCHRHAGEPGVKAVILYPMNALASDQARRFAEEIWKDDRLKGRVTAGMYVGGHADDRTLGPDNVITDRDTLRAHPPDILMTNYKMLDYLMIRPEDQKIWKDTGPESVRYLVLDELHTYDGAQGSDVACLIRRFKAKLETRPGSLCCVGTSATLAGDEAKATADLLEFAGRLFGETIPRSGVIREDRVEMTEYLGAEETHGAFPDAGADALLPAPGDTIDAYVDRQCGLWFGRTGVTALEIGEELRRHGFLRAVLMNLENQVTEWTALREKIASWDPDFAALPESTRDALLQSFVTLVSAAKQDFEGHIGPFIQCQVQLWVREMSRMARQVDWAPKFFWRDDTPLRDPRKGLPAVYCRECGHTGWVGYKRVQDARITDDPRIIYREYAEHGRNVCYLFPGTHPDLLPGAQERLCTQCLTLGHDPVCAACSGECVPVYRHTCLSGGDTPKDMARCPDCDSDYALWLVGSQAASLSSVAVSHLYTSPFNRDRKLLAFTDSVQDASHRAGFFAARTYRFNLRTALQTVLEAEPSGVLPLAAFADRMVEYWSKRMTGQELIATFLPPDLAGLGVYRQFIRSKSKQPGKRLLGKFMTRLSWEIAMEFGFNARVGRTLDKVGCSTAVLDPARLELAVERLQAALANHVAPLEKTGPERLRRFLLGLLTRARQRGGVSHALLEGYAANGGKWYFLTKKQAPLLSPFSSESRLPRFLSLTPGEKVFDALVQTGNYATWYVDWARRVLDPNLDTGLCNELYRRTVDALEAAGLLERIGNRNPGAWSIPREALIITRHTAQARSEAEGHALTVGVDELPLWEGMPSLVFRAADAYRRNGAPAMSYYRNFYRSGQVKRIFCHEHTGILQRETREDVEHQFKTGEYADAPNLLACTPTLEMGIDVGDLSSVMVCSIPPTPTNYLQRIGRGGRKTGNALVLAIANVKPHDLYFFDDPFEMIGGSVTPPGCYLDAPEMLKRQFLAFCMDAWSRDDGTAERMPKNVQFLLAAWKRGGYPKTFLDYARTRREALSDRFAGLFGDVVSKGNRERLREYALSGEYERELDACLNGVAQELDRLRGQLKRVKHAREGVAANRAGLTDADERLRELDYEMDLLRRLIDLVSKKYPLNLFTDEGLIPNYAFPETGVKLKSLIYGVEGGDGQTASEPHEYIRGAGTAIRELAPFNTFYAESRKVTVDQVDTGGRAQSLLEDWQFCNVCHRLERVTAEEQYKTCPNCGSAGWEDVGQKHILLPLRQVSARSSDFESRTSDESDEREMKTYILNDFIDIRPENWGGGYANPDLPFGFEYLKQVTLREVNFGLRDVIGKTFMAAGQPVPEEGFVLCRDCGVVWRKNEKEPRHRYWCYYAQGNRTAEWAQVFLYRQVQSEAIRILLPVSILEAETRLATFKACLELGLRRKFKGNPGHLILREQVDPGRGGDAAPRNFLVLYDSVPGGTGYLKEFVNNPAEFRNLLEEAFKTLKSCPCRQREGADGCYRCLYAYQHQYELEQVSREKGIEMLEAILKAWDGLKPAQTLERIDLPDDFIESELEGRFIAALGKAFEKPEHRWSKVLRNGKPCYTFKSGNRAWTIEPQVQLSGADGVAAPSRPDMVLWPSGDEAGVLPVAVFMDGFLYHVRPDDPHGGIADDIDKRTAILRSGRFLVWSLTWNDLEDFDRERHTAEACLFSGLAPRWETARRLLHKIGNTFDTGLAAASGMDTLLAYLKHPDPKTWGRGMAAVVLNAMLFPPLYDVAQVDRLAEALCGEAAPEMTEPEPVDHGAGCLARLHREPAVTLLLHCGLEEANQFEWNRVRAVLRIEDDPASRSAEGYKDAWRKALGAANLFQFLPAFAWTSAELAGVKTGKRPEAPEPEKQETAADIDREELQEALELCDPACRELLKACARAGKPLPVVGYELAGPDGRVCAEAELAWPDAKIVVLTEAQAEFAGLFEERGWQVFHPDDGNVIDIL